MGKKRNEDSIEERIKSGLIGGFAMWLFLTSIVLGGGILFFWVGTGTTFIPNLEFLVKTIEGRVFVFFQIIFFLLGFYAASHKDFKKM